MLIICDLDGVLVEASWERLFKAYKALINESKKNWEDFFKNIEEFKKWWNPDWQENEKRLYLEDIERCHKVFYENYNGVDIGLFYWVPEIIHKLSKIHQLAIFTNSHNERTRILVEPVSEYFSCIICSEDVSLLKPDPEGIYKILSILKVENRDALMIGDMPADIMAGKAAGIKTGAVKWGLGDWDELVKCSPDYAFEKYEHLLKI